MNISCLTKQYKESEEGAKIITEYGESFAAEILSFWDGKQDPTLEEAKQLGRKIYQANQYAKSIIDTDLRAKTMSEYMSDIQKVYGQDYMQKIEQLNKELALQLAVTKGEITLDKDVQQSVKDSEFYLKNQDKLGKAESFLHYLVEGRDTLKFYEDLMINVKKDVNLDEFEKVRQINEALRISNAYDQAIKLFDIPLIGSKKDNSVKILVDSMREASNNIKALYDEVNPYTLARTLADSQLDHYQRELDKINNEITRLQGRITAAKQSGDSKRVEKLEKEIENQKKLIDKLPSEINLEETIRGQRGDSSVISLFAEATISNGNVFIGSFAKYIKDSFTKLRIKLLDVKNEFATEYNKYVSETGVSRHNPKELFKGLYYVTSRLVKDKETGEYKKQEYLSLLGEFEGRDAEGKTFYEKQSELKNSVQETYDKFGKDSAEYADALQKMLDWKNKIFEQEFKESFYRDKELLTKEALAARTEILDKIKGLQAGINKGVISAESLESIGNLWDEYRALGNSYNNGVKKTGQELKIAESIQSFNKERNKKITYTTTDRSRELYNKEKERVQALLDADKITQEDYDEWYKQNTTREILPEFWEQKKEITDRINDILNQIPKDTAKLEDISEAWQKIQSIVTEHRDYNGVVDGGSLNKEDVKEVKDTLAKIDEIRSKLDTLSGLTKSESKELRQLRMIPVLDLSDSESERLEELTTKKSKISEYISESDKTELEILFDRLNGLQTSIPTSYYDETYKRELAKYAESVKDKKLTDKQIEDSFKTSEWYLDNHKTVYKSEKDGSGTYSVKEEMQPIYIWMDFIPLNEKYIKKDQPAFKYKERVVKDQYKNPNYKDGHNRPQLKKKVDGVDNPYLSKEYQALKAAGGARFEFLNYLTELYLSNQNELPSVNRLGLIIPSIEKDFFEKLASKKAGDFVPGKEAFKEFFSGLKRSLTDNEQDVDYGLASVENVRKKIIPVKHTGNIELDMQSHNIGEAILKFVSSAQSYKMLKDLEPLADSASNAVKNLKVDTSTLNKQAEQLGLSKFIKMSDKSNTELAIQQFIDAIFYGEVQKIQKLGKINVSKIANTATKFNSIITLGFNIVNSITNLVSGNVQELIEAIGGEHFTLKDYAKAKMLYYKNATQMFADISKEGNKGLYSQMVDLFDVMQGEFEDHYGNKASWSVLKSAKENTLMFMKNVGEHEIQVSTFLAMCNNKMVNQNGKMIPLQEAYEIHEGKIRLKDGVDFSEQDFIDFTNKLHSILRKLNGNYDKFNKTYSEKFWWGRWLMTMRKFIVPMVTRRWSSSRFDAEMGELEEGYHLTTFKAILKDIASFNFNVVHNWADYSDKQKIAIKKTAFEHALLAIFFVLLKSLGYDDDKDLKNNSVLTNNIILQAIRVQSDTRMFASPIFGMQEISNVASSPLMPAATWDRHKQIFKDLANLIIQDDDNAYLTKEKYGWQEGDAKFLYDLDKLTPDYQVRKVIHPDEAIKSFNYAIRQ
jgi:Mg2+ and Co2+ transporter CorA